MNGRDLEPGISVDISLSQQGRYRRSWNWQKDTPDPAFFCPGGRYSARGFAGTASQERGATSCKALTAFRPSIEGNMAISLGNGR